MGLCSERAVSLLVGGRGTRPRGRVRALREGGGFGVVVVYINKGKVGAPPSLCLVIAAVYVRRRCGCWAGSILFGSCV